MPHSLSATKRLRQNKTVRTRNRTIKSHIRAARRSFDEAVDAKDMDGARLRLRLCERLLHRAANQGPLHRKTAGRLISRLHQRLTRIEQAAN